MRIKLSFNFIFISAPATMATSRSDVRSLVDRFDTQLFRNAIAGGGNDATSLSRHGSGAS